MENEIFQRNKKFDELKATLNLDEMALEKWLEESAKRDEDVMTFLKYNIKDEGRIKTLNLQLEKLCEISKKKKFELEKETTETLALQIELDKTAEEFKNIHFERQDLILQWEKIIQQMQIKDSEISQMAGKLADIKQDIRYKQEESKDKEQFLKAEHDNNEDVVKKTIEFERTLGKLRVQFQDEELMRDQFKSELEALARTTERTALDLESTRSQVTRLKRESNDKHMALQDLAEKKQDLAEKLKVIELFSLKAS